MFRFDARNGSYYWPDPKHITGKQSEFITVKTGSANDFFSNARSIMRAADNGEPIKQCGATLTFVDPSEMLRFLSAAKIIIGLKSILLLNLMEHKDGTHSSTII